MPSATVIPIALHRRVTGPCIAVVAPLMRHDSQALR